VDKGLEDKKVKMRETLDSGAESTRESDMEASQDLELEKVDLDIPWLREIHGSKKINSLTIVQIKRIQKDLENGKGKENNYDSEPPPSGVMGINTNPLKSPKNSQEKKKEEVGNPTTKR
jgi:hypothetical protein